MNICIIAIAGCLGMVSTGLLLGWGSPSLPLLMQEDSPIRLTEDQASWVATILILGALVGSVVSGLTVDTYGRKNVMLVSFLPSFIGWLMIAFATTPLELYVSRFVSGIGYGTTYAITPLYFSEISPPQIRGALGTFLIVSLGSGNLMACSIGPFVSVKTLAWISLAIPILYGVMVIWLPESPYHLMRHQRHRDAEASLAWIRGTKDVGPEIDSIRRSIEANRSSFGELFFVPENRRALMAVLGVIATQQLSGYLAVLAYSQTIFDAANIGFEGKYLAIVLGILQVLCLLPCSRVFHCGGRKSLLAISATGTAISMFIVASYFYLIYSRYDLAWLGWLPVIGFSMYIVTFSIGLAILPHTVITEIFPTNVEALGGTIIHVFGHSLSFTTIKLFQLLSDNVGIFAAFWAFSISGVLGTLFVAFYVPETKRETLHEIELKLNALNTDSME